MTSTVKHSNVSFEFHQWRYWSHLSGLTITDSWHYQLCISNLKSVPILSCREVTTHWYLLSQDVYQLSNYVPLDHWPWRKAYVSSHNFLNSQYKICALHQWHQSPSSIPQNPDDIGRSRYEHLKARYWSSRLLHRRLKTYFRIRINRNDAQSMVPVRVLHMTIRRGLYMGNTCQEQARWLRYPQSFYLWIAFWPLHPHSRLALFQMGVSDILILPHYNALAILSHVDGLPRCGL